ncbi:hypothetical protein Ais01nite_62490 [Asanoa ishikariensis]|uniref:Uncharacterized protein n=1 Tax=Asanoa ishikariensis TaxID=137265 RepID=A0A1H3P0G6_9ACTN|nr:hypothetical protein [Asanoa ishikariensis]GIF68214.1 hypothetical protein Ais01nite_62490 [Asanoa ishikariensis]SDY94541.1 hypothetical protein SAMN05421684_2478 [Asanoa ishikariensis]
MSAASGDNNALSLLACVLFVLGVVIVALAVARRRAGDRARPRHRLGRDSGHTGHRRRRNLFRRERQRAEQAAAEQAAEPVATAPPEPVHIFDEPPASAWAPPDQGGWAPSVDTGGTTQPAGPAGPAERAGPRDDADTLDLGGDLPTARLLAQADAALVAADNALSTSEQELAFAQAQHGRDATVAFVEAVTAARADVAEAFRIRQHLDDHEPEDEFSRRRVLRAIVEHCAAAGQRLDARAEPFELLRSSEEARLGGRLTVRRDEARTRLTVAGTTWKELAAAYADSALRPIADNLAQAAARIDFAGAEIEQEGRRTGLRTAQQALGQAEALLDALDTYAADLATAEDAAAELLADLHAEVAAGKAVLAMAGRPPGNARGDKVGLAADVTRADEAASALATELAEARPDPVAGLRRLEAASGPLGESLGAVRDPSSRVSHAREQLDQAMFAARATIDAAAGFLVTRRGAVGARARTRLFAARCELGQAAVATEAEPVEALAAARAAESLANQSLAAARADVERWTPPTAEGLECALLGGIVHAPDQTGRPYGSRFGGPGTRDRDRAA